MPFEDVLWALLGAWLVLGGFPALLGLCYQAATFPPKEDSMHYAVLTSMVSEMGSILAALVGVAIFLRGRRIARWLRGHDRTVPVVMPLAPAMPSACPACSHPFRRDDYRANAVERLCGNCQEPLPVALFEGRGGS